MIQNSVVVQFVVKIFQLLNSYYEHSALHKVFMAIGNGLKRAGSGSIILSAFNSKSSVVEDSVFFKIVKNFATLVNKIFDCIGDLFRRSLGNSLVLDTLSFPGQSLNNAFYVLGMLFASYGIPVILRGNLLGFIFLFLGNLLLLFSHNPQVIFANSDIVKIIKRLYSRIFLSDEEV